MTILMWQRMRMPLPVVFDSRAVNHRSAAGVSRSLERYGLPPLSERRLPTLPTTPHPHVIEELAIRYLEIWLS